MSHFNIQQTPNSFIPTFSGHETAIPNPFISKEGYKHNVNPIKNAIKQGHNFIKNVSTLSDEEARDFIVNKIKLRKDPWVKYYYKNNVGDKVQGKMRLTEYIKMMYNKDTTVAPSLTSYMKPKKDGGQDSLYSSFTSINLVKRAKVKHEAAEAYMDGRFWEATELTNVQKTIKLLNNALSGAFASPSTVHYNPSAHYTLTSITRSVSSIGNTVTESLSGGNRIYFTLDDVLSHITDTVTRIPDGYYIGLIEDYGIHAPTPQEVLDVIHYSSDLYWKSKVNDEILLKYLNGLESHDLAKIAYNNDLLHFTKYNKEFSHKMILEFGSKKIGLVDKDKQVAMCEGQPHYLENLMTHICEEELRGIKFKPKDYIDTTVLDVVSSTYFHLSNVMKKYKDIFTALFSNQVLPINVAHTKEMIRRVIVLSDTDSTCGTYDHWVVDILGENDMGPVAIGISASVMTMTALAIENAINVFTTNMNVGEESMGKLKMKNEYFWKTFAIGGGTKHYYALMYIKEGSVYKDDVLELKGSQFIVSKTPLKYRDENEKMFMDINNTIANNEKLDASKYISWVLRIENEILDRIMRGDYEILSITEIKDSSAYKTPKASPYAHYKFWNEVMAPKYGQVEAPPYNAIKYSLNLSKKGQINKFLEEIKDQELKARFIAYMERTGRGSLATQLLPMDIIMDKGLPEEFREVVNTSKIINGVCSAMYLTLATLGIQVEADSTLHEMGYKLEEE